MSRACPSEQGVHWWRVNDAGTQGVCKRCGETRTYEREPPEPNGFKRTQQLFTKDVPPRTAGWRRT